MPPSSIEFLCDGCRRWILRGIDVVQNTLRETSGMMDYGRTPAAIRRTIQFVRRGIDNEKKHVIRLRDVIQEYNRLVKLTGETTKAYKSDRTILSFIQPSLSQSGIFLRTSSRKDGSYFCKLSKFDCLSREESMDLSPFPHPSPFMKMLEPLIEYISTRQFDILNGEWEIHEFIKQCPDTVWSFFVHLCESVTLLRRGRAEARIQGSKDSDEWPLNPRKCPDDISVRALHEFNYAVQIYFSIERFIF